MLTDTSEWVGTTLCEGRYRVLRKLGEGGMAHVYLARDDKLERDVVIKVPRSNLIHDATFTGRFTREVRSLAKLAHPHIVPLIDIGEHDKVPFAVMNYLTGGSLRDRQPRRANGEPLPMPVAQLGSWLPAVAQALDFVHKNKYIHRDIKPENVLFDEDGQPFVSDLGIIKALTEPQDPSKQTVFTGAGMVLGTPQYMAPELIMGEKVDGRADQYALAVMVYEAVAGQLPFNGSSAPAIFIQQTTKLPAPLRSLIPDMPASLAAAVEKALAKLPSERFATCVGFAEAALAEIAPLKTPTAATPAFPKTVMEDRVFKEPVIATLLEAAPRMETPSDLRGPTAPSRAPSPVTTPAARITSPATALEARPAPAARSRAPLFIGLIVFAALVGGGGFFAYNYLPRANAATLEIAAVKPLALEPGDRQPFAVEIERRNVTGDVKCWLENLPAGVSAEAIVVPADKKKGTIHVVVESRSAAAKANAVLKASCGTAEAKTAVELAVTVPEPKLTIQDIDAQTINAGSEISVPLEIKRVNCKGPVRIDVVNQPELLAKGIKWYPKFASKTIREEESSYKLEFSAAGNAAKAEVMVKVTADLKDLKQAIAEFKLTVVPAPVTPMPDPPVTEEPKKKKDPPPDLVGKDNPPKKKDDVPMPQIPIPVDPNAELILKKMPDIVMKAGSRRILFVQIERKAFVGAVGVGVGGDFNGKVYLSPISIPTIRPDVDSIPFEIVADATALNVTMPVTVTALYKNLRVKTTFNLTIQRPPGGLVPQAENLWEKSDKLTNADPLDKARTSSRCKTFTVPLVAGKTYTIDLISQAFDPYLRIENSNGTEVASDDDSGGGLNSRIVLTPRESGVYYLIVTSFAGDQIGAFRMTIR